MQLILTENDIIIQGAIIIRTIFKRTATAVTVLAVALTLIVFNTPKNINAAAEETQGTHSHKVCGGLEHVGCGHEEIVFEPFPDNERILRGKAII